MTAALAPWPPGTYVRTQYKLKGGTLKPSNDGYYLLLVRAR